MGSYKACRFINISDRNRVLTLEDLLASLGLIDRKKNAH